MLTYSEDGHECFVDAPLLFWGNSADQFAQATSIDRTDLLYQDPGVFAKQIYLWSKRRRPSAAGCRCY